MTRRSQWYSMHKNLARSKDSIIRLENTEELKLRKAKKFLDENGKLIDDILLCLPVNSSRVERQNPRILERERTMHTRTCVAKHLTKSSTCSTLD